MKKYSLKKIENKFILLDNKKRFFSIIENVELEKFPIVEKYLLKIDDPLLLKIKDSAVTKDTFVCLIENGDEEVIISFKTKLIKQIIGNIKNTKYRIHKDYKVLCVFDKFKNQIGALMCLKSSVISDRIDKEIFAQKKEKNRTRMINWDK